MVSDLAPRFNLLFLACLDSYTPGSWNGLWWLVLGDLHVVSMMDSCGCVETPMVMWFVWQMTRRYVCVILAVVDGWWMPQLGSLFIQVVGLFSCWHLHGLTEMSKRLAVALLTSSFHSWLFYAQLVTLRITCWCYCTIHLPLGIRTGALISSTRDICAGILGCEGIA